jgi:hypothetical protein
MNKTTISRLTRRRVVAGAGTVGALAAAAAALPLAPAPTEVKTVASAKPQAEPQDGYQLTDHVKRYYQTAKV